MSKDNSDLLAKINTMTDALARVGVDVERAELATLRTHIDLGRDEGTCVAVWRIVGGKAYQTSIIRHTDVAVDEVFPVAQQITAYQRIKRL